jgi:hypothetical protein
LHPFSLVKTTFCTSAALRSGSNATTAERSKEECSASVEETKYTTASASKMAILAEIDMAVGVGEGGSERRRIERE